jgi:hypothetical protein
LILIAERLPRCEVVVENVREQKRAALDGAIDLIRSAI